MTISDEKFRKWLGIDSGAETLSAQGLFRAAGDLLAAAELDKSDHITSVGIVKVNGKFNLVDAPIVVAVNEAFSLRGGSPHRKYTIARWNSTHVPMDWDGMLAELRKMEPGWGGSSSICGSPQGVGSTLTMDQVTAVVGVHGRRRPRRPQPRSPWTRSQPW